MGFVAGQTHTNLREGGSKLGAAVMADKRAVIEAVYGGRVSISPE